MKCESTLTLNHRPPLIESELVATGGLGVVSARNIPFFWIWPTMKKQHFFIVKSTMKFIVESTMKNEDFGEFTSPYFSEKGL